MGGLLSGSGAMGFGLPSTAMNRWVVLNQQLMDDIYCLYLRSDLLRTIMVRLETEVLRGGVELQETLYGANVPEYKGQIGMGRKSMSQYQEQHVLNTLKRAILYGHLYGLVPITIGNSVEDGSAGGPGQGGRGAYNMRIPLPHSGRFVAKQDNRGNLSVGWQWRDHNLRSQTAGPAKGVWVFVWADMEPLIGAPSPFNSSITAVFNRIMRTDNLVEMDMHGYYEMTHPPLVLQEHPRTDRSSVDREIYEFAAQHYIADPRGDGMGPAGPGGTMTGQQRYLAAQDTGAAVRSNQSVRAAIESTPGTTQTRIDPTTGEIYTEEHTLLYERGYFRAPSGWVPTSSHARPMLRGDLLQIVEYNARSVAGAFGVPPLFINSGETDVRSRRQFGTSSGSVTGGAVQYNAALENMRETVKRVRQQLTTLYELAHYHLIWDAERFNLSKRVAELECDIETRSSGCTDELVERKLELLGETLAEAERDRLLSRDDDRAELERAAEIATIAQGIFRGKQMQKNIDAILGVVRRSTDMTLEEIGERERRGEGLLPADEGLLRDPDDVQGDLTQPPVKDARRKRGKKGKVDPNELASYMGDRPELYSRVQVGPNTVQRKYWPGPGSMQDAIEEAAEIVDARRKLLEDQKELARMSEGVRPGDGTPKIRLIFRSLPTPDWAMLRSMAADGILDADRLADMMLIDLGLDPKIYRPPKSVKPMHAAIQLNMTGVVPKLPQPSNNTSSTSSSSKKKNGKRKATAAASTSVKPTTGATTTTTANKKPKTNGTVPQK